ncbi:egg cell-secreted protein 1.1-like [Primulina huaijiensis]|uniref:egg cell-secreted protein 1.1-like n=1 Tax=Primulina huaijiensis TaxID=1492673 RepID=UPI003CC79634
MDSTLNVLLTSMLLCFLATSAVEGRILVAKPVHGLDEAGESSGCFDSLFQLQSCTSEVVMFFLNGETYLGPGCCAAIKTIQHDCWPNMLGSLGYTTEEGDILRGYCDASDDSGSIGDDSGSAETLPRSPPKGH